MDQMDENLKKILELMRSYNETETFKASIAQNMAQSTLTVKSAVHHTDATVTTQEPEKLLPSEAANTNTIIQDDEMIDATNNTDAWKTVGGKRHRVITPEIQMKAKSSNTNKFKALAMDDDEEAETIINLPSTIKPQVVKKK